MTREEALNMDTQKVRLDCSGNIDGVTKYEHDNIINEIFNDFDKQVKKLEQQVAYWKLSFKKQCEASRSV